MDGEGLSLQLSALRSVVGSVGLYQDYEASGDRSQISGPETDHLHRRHFDCGMHTTGSTGSGTRSDLPLGEPGLHDQSRKIDDRAGAGNRVPGLKGKLPGYGVEDSSNKDQEDQSRSERTPSNGGKPECTLDFDATGGNDSCSPRHDGSPAVLQDPRNLQSCLRQTLQEGPEQNYAQTCRLTSQANEELARWVTHLPDWNGQAILKAEPDLTIETDASTTGLGSILPEYKDRVTLVESQVQAPHKLPGASGSVLSNKGLCQGPVQSDHTSENGQYVGSDVYQQVRWLSLTRTECPDQRDLDMVSGEKYNSQGDTPGREAEREGGRRVQSDERSHRLETLSPDLSEDKCQTWPSRD